MRRHAVDLIALLAGVAFALTAGGFLVYELSDTRVDGVWVVALGLMFLGVVALTATFLSRPPRVDVEQPASEGELSDATS